MHALRQFARSQFDEPLLPTHARRPPNARPPSSATGISPHTPPRAGVSRRFGDHWRVALDVNVFLGPHGKLESASLKDDNGGARIAYFF